MFSRGMVRLPLSELSGVVSEPVKSASAIERPRQRPPALRPGRGRRSSQTLSARGRVTSPAIAPGSWRPSSGWPETASFATGGDRGGTRRLPRPLSRGLPPGLPRRLAPIIPVGTGIFAEDDLHRLLGAAFLLLGQVGEHALVGLGERGLHDAARPHAPCQYHIDLRGVHGEFRAAHPSGQLAACSSPSAKKPPPSGPM
jgi:hypothetical protein